MLVSVLKLSIFIGLVGAIDLDRMCHTRVPARKNVTSWNFAPFILNGRPAKIHNYQFKLSLHINGKFSCSASVISSKFSLTAAHCLEFNVEPEHITLTGGSVNRVEGGVTFQVEEFFLHPNYDPIILDYDVALMKIKGSFLGHQNIHPVILANEGCHTDSGLVVTLAGWGMNEHGVYPEELFEINQKIVDNNFCLTEWGEDITSRMLCADVIDEIDSCSGDSGGAVLKNGCLQVGIISFGSNICGFEIPSVFTRIENREIRKFIRDISGV